MKRQFRSLVYVLALGVSMTALSLGGTAGCGSSGGGGGGGTASSDEAAGEATAALTSVAGVAAAGDAGALILRSEQAGLKAQEVDCTESGGAITCDCAVSGSFTIDADSIDFDDCSIDSGETLDGSISISESGDTITLTLSDLTFTDTDCGSFSIDGTVRATPVDSDTVTVDIDVDIDTDDGSVSLDCTFNSDDTCPEIADACGFDSADVCEGDDFGSIDCE